MQVLTNSNNLFKKIVLKIQKNLRYKILVLKILVLKNNPRFRAVDDVLVDRQ